MRDHGFWWVLRRRVMPALVSIAAIAVTAAAVVFIVDTLRDEETPVPAAAATTGADDSGPGTVDAGPTGGDLGGFDVAALLGLLAQLGDVSPADGPVLGVRAEETPDGVAVRAVMPGQPADEAGVEPGDVIESVNGQPVATLEELREALDAIDPGEEYALAVQRDGAAESFTVRRAEGGPGGLAELIGWLLEWLTEGRRG